MGTGCLCSKACLITTMRFGTNFFRLRFKSEPEGILVHPATFMRMEAFATAEVVKVVEMLPGDEVEAALTSYTPFVHGIKIRFSSASDEALITWFGVDILPQQIVPHAQLHPKLAGWVERHLA